MCRIQNVQMDCTHAMSLHAITRSVKTTLTGQVAILQIMTGPTCMYMEIPSMKEGDSQWLTAVLGSLGLVSLRQPRPGKPE